MFSLGFHELQELNSLLQRLDISCDAFDLPGEDACRFLLNDCLSCQLFHIRGEGGEIRFYAEKKLSIFEAMAVSTVVSKRIAMAEIKLRVVALDFSSASEIATGTRPPLSLLLSAEVVVVSVSTLRDVGAHFSLRGRGSHLVLGRRPTVAQ